MSHFRLLISRHDLSRRLFSLVQPVLLSVHSRRLGAGIHCKIVHRLGAKRASGVTESPGRYRSRARAARILLVAALAGHKCAEAKLLSLGQFAIQLLDGVTVALEHCL